MNNSNPGYPFGNSGPQPPPQSQFQMNIQQQQQQQQFMLMHQMQMQQQYQYQQQLQQQSIGQTNFSSAPIASTIQQQLSGIPSREDENSADPSVALDLKAKKWAQMNSKRFIATITNFN